MARPRKKIDPVAVEKLAMIGCTVPEIAAYCDCSVDTIDRRFADLVKKGKEQGKSSLRRMQWKAAEAGNTGMLVWLGKQLLGQRDKTEFSGPGGGPMQIHRIERVIVDPQNTDR